MLVSCDKTTDLRCTVVTSDLVKKPTNEQMLYRSNLLLECKYNKLQFDIRTNWGKKTKTTDLHVCNKIYNKEIYAGMTTSEGIQSVFQ